MKIYCLKICRLHGSSAGEDDDFLRRQASAAVIFSIISLTPSSAYFRILSHNSCTKTSQLGTLKSQSQTMFSTNGANVSLFSNLAIADNVLATAVISATELAVAN